jgi:anti-sigma28 factor (negative regulator of flagellin synthesis)
MKVNDHGFTERVGGAATTVSAPGSGANGRSSSGSQKNGSSGDLQLSGFAARLNSGLSAETSSRANRVSQIAKTISSGTFTVDTAAMSHSIVSEALQSGG